MPAVLQSLMNIIRALVVRFTTNLFGSTVGGTLLSFVGLGFLLDKYNQYLNEWWNSEGTQAYVFGLVSPWVADWAMAKTGLVLDRDEPFSNASLSAAIGLRLGVTLRDITSRETTLSDLGVALAQRVNNTTGANFEAFYPVDDLPAIFGREVAISMQRSLSGGGSAWVPQIYVDQVVTAVRAFDGVIANYDAKKARINMLSRLRQRKYSLTHKRVGMWVPR